MTQQRVLDYIIEHGPIQMSKIEVEGMTRKAISGVLMRLVDNNSIVKDDETEKGRRRILYSAKVMEVEPDYSVILRNLPREFVYHD
jgi:DNA-binding MarR family transcriptional regulator